MAAIRAISWYVVLLWTCWVEIFIWSSRFGRGRAKTPLALAGTGVPTGRPVPCKIAAGDQAHR